MRFEGLYRGIVIQNNDPENSGRVKVFIPGFNITQVKDWNQEKEEDKYFRVMGKNTNSSLTKDILESQKEKLFWAEVMMPVVGMSAPGYYHAPSDTYYIGNDSNYNNQNSNKTDDFFINDAAQASSRLSTFPQLPPYSTLPRTDIILNFPQIGSKFCINTKCENSKNEEENDIDNELNKNSNNSKNPILSELPKKYIVNADPKLDTDINISNDPVLRNDILNDEVPNQSIIGVQLSVIDPVILIDGKPLPKNSPIYNPGCFINIKNESTINFEPPILFKTIPIPDSINTISLPRYSEIPVGLSINGRVSELDNLQLTSFTPTTVTYKKDNIEVIIDKKNIEEIIVMDLGLTSDIQRIQGITPIISNSNPISITPSSGDINIGPSAGSTTYIDLGVVIDVQRIPGSRATKTVFSNNYTPTILSSNIPPIRTPSIPPVITTTSNSSNTVTSTTKSNETLFIDLGVVLDIQRIPGSKSVRIISSGDGSTPLVSVSPKPTTSTSNNVNNIVSTSKVVPVKSAFTKTPIMPRAPKSFGQGMSSRGGGGGEIFNTVTSLLLPIFMRKDSHIGGANNESRLSINRGRIPLNDINNVKGCNTRSPNAGQMHRGPMRSADYNNNWKGIISIPGVGAHVWVRFESGDSNYPIVVGTFMSQTDYKGIYKIQPIEKTAIPEESTPPVESPVNAASEPPNLDNTPSDNATDGPDSSLFPNSGAEGAVPLSARQTSYGYPGDPYSDSNSAVGIGAFVPSSEQAKIRAGENSIYKLRPGDIAVSPDVERTFKNAGVTSGQTVKLTYSDGTVHTGRWMDRTSPSLSNRIDIYSPTGQHPRDGVKLSTVEPQ